MTISVMVDDRVIVSTPRVMPVVIPWDRNPARFLQHVERSRVRDLCTGSLALYFGLVAVLEHFASKRYDACVDPFLTGRVALDVSEPFYAHVVPGAAAPAAPVSGGSYRTLRDGSPRCRYVYSEPTLEAARGALRSVLVSGDHLPYAMEHKKNRPFRVASVLDPVLVDGMVGFVVCIVDTRRVLSVSVPVWYKSHGRTKALHVGENGVPTYTTEFASAGQLLDLLTMRVGRLDMDAACRPALVAMACMLCEAKWSSYREYLSRVVIRLYDKGSSTGCSFQYSHQDSPVFAIEFGGPDGYLSQERFALSQLQKLMKFVEARVAASKRCVAAPTRLL
jgi:hypothetical protein